MKYPMERTHFEVAARQWQTLVDIQLVHDDLIPDESNSGTELDLYVFRDASGQALMKFTLEAPSGWALIWDIGQGGGRRSGTP